jgi:hypothetical protein
MQMAAVAGDPAPASLGSGKTSRSWDRGHRRMRKSGFRDAAGRPARRGGMLLTPNVLRDQAGEASCANPGSARRKASATSRASSARGA